MRRTHQATRSATGTDGHSADAGVTEPNARRLTASTARPRNPVGASPSPESEESSASQRAGSATTRPTIPA